MAQVVHPGSLRREERALEVDAQNARFITRELLHGRERHLGRFHRIGD